MLYRWLRKHRWFYGLMTLLTIVGLSLSPVIRAEAIDWGEVIRRGGEVLQTLTISEAQEVEIGGQLNDRIAKEMKLEKRSDLAKYVDEIGQKLAAQSDRPKLKYTFQVVNDDGINAFATMGGFVYINKGTIMAADNEAQLASVIGHEIGHITGKHALKRLQTAAKVQLGLGVIGVKTNVLVDIAYELLLNRPNGRQAEFDADTRGLKMIANASYAQPEMANFMRKLIKDGVRVPTLLSTHPDTRDRVAALEAQIKKAPTSGTAGTDPVTYAQRVKKPVSKTPEPTTKPSPSPSPSPSPTPTPTPSPMPGGVVVPTTP
jgi:beta-barrel assembly-enhancing protease